VKEGVESFGHGFCELLTPVRITATLVSEQMEYITIRMKQPSCCTEVTVQFITLCGFYSYPEHCLLSVDFVSDLLI
jgi:hypothetical protein